MNQLFENIVNNDLTIKFFVREGSFNSTDFKQLNHKIDLRIIGIKIALKRYLDIKYPTKK